MASSNRKISVIMVADAVGYSKHMEANEDATLASYKECEAILKDLLKNTVQSLIQLATRFNRVFKWIMLLNVGLSFNERLSKKIPSKITR